MNQDEEDVEMIGTGTGTATATGTRGSSATQEDLDLMLALSLAFDENQPYDADIRRDVNYEFEAGTATVAADNTLQSQVNAQRSLASQQAQEESPSRAGLGTMSSSQQEQASESNTMPNRQDAMEEEGDFDESDDDDGEFIYEDDSDYEYDCESSTASQRSVPTADNNSDGESGTSFEVVSHNGGAPNADNGSDNESGTSFEVVYQSGTPNIANNSDGESGSSFEVLSHGVESMDEMSVEDIKNDMQCISLSDDVLPFDDNNEFQWLLPSLDKGVQVSPESQSTVDVKWKQKCLEVLKGLPYRENRWGFCVPKNIMDLECIEKMLENDVYKAIEDFQSDVNRTFDEAMAHHKKGTVMHERAKEMKAKFEVECINKLPQPGEMPTVPTSAESSNNNTITNTNHATEQSYPTPALPQPCLDVLKGLQDHSYGWVFNQPIDPDLMGLPDYFDVIKKPMDLSTVMSKLQRCEYGAIEEFQADVNLTFDNAMKYNGVSSPVYELAQTLKDKFEIDYERLVPQVEKQIEDKFEVHYKKLGSEIEKNVPTSAISPTPEPPHKRHVHFDPTEESVTPIPTRDLTAQNVRWAIEIYAREHPDDLGMPIKKLMKFFGIRRFSPSATRGLFEKIINQECLLETTDDIGRVLFLKEKEKSSDIGARKNDEIMDIDGDNKGIDGDRKIEPLSIGYIQKCTSIRELQNIIVRLGQPNDKSNTDTSRLVRVATQRLRTLREKIALNDEYVDDDDFPGFDALTIEFIENCTSERVLEQIMNRFAPKFSWKWNASFPPIQCEQKYAAKPLAPGTWSFHEAASKRLKALGHSGTTHETRLMDQHRRLAENKPTTMKMEDMDELVALSLCLNEKGDDPFYIASDLQRVHAEAKTILKNPLPSYYYYDESNLVLRDFFTDPLDEDRKKSALRYISNCTFAAELRGIIRFWEAPENFELGSQLLRSKGRPPFHVEFVEAERELLHASFVAFTKAQLKALLSHEDAIRFPSRKLDTEYRSRWFIRDFDIQLTRDIPKGWNDIEGHPGNLWLQGLVAEKLCYVMDGNWESKVVETFKVIIQRIKNEGRRLFQLELSRRTNRRLFWIEPDDKLVMDELIYLFRCEFNKREAVRSMAQSRDTRFVPELGG